MPEIIVIAHNIRSAHNIGSLFRTCDGFGVHQLVLSGYSPYPTLPNDSRLPHLRQRITSQIHKTALGAEASIPYTYQPIPDLAKFQAQGYTIVGLEQDARSIQLSTYRAPEKIVLLIGEEVAGIAPDLRRECEVLLEIPMRGKKESFNVGVATGIALYQLTLVGVD